MVIGKKKKKEELRGVYIISVAAELTDCHPQTLRLYERRGLITPSRTSKNRRRYTDLDIERLRHIQVLTQEYGLNLAGVKMVLEMEERIEGLKERVRLTEERVSVIREQLQAEITDIKRSRKASLLKRPTTSLVPRFDMKKTD